MNTRLNTVAFLKTNPRPLIHALHALSLRPIARVPLHCRPSCARSFPSVAQKGAGRGTNLLIEIKGIKALTLLAAVIKMCSMVRPFHTPFLPRPGPFS